MKLTREVKIALVAVAGIIILFFGMNFLKGLSLFSNNTSYYITFNNVSGVAVSTPIYVNGYKVGVVKKVIFDSEHHTEPKVLIDVNPEMRIPQGSTAEISSAMLGNVQINLLLGNSPQM